MKHILKLSFLGMLIFLCCCSSPEQDNQSNDTNGKNFNKLQKVSHGQGGPSEHALCVIGYSHIPEMTVSPSGKKIVYTEIIGYKENDGLVAS